MLRRTIRNARFMCVLHAHRQLGSGDERKGGTQLGYFSVKKLWIYRSEYYIKKIIAAGPSYKGHVYSPTRISFNEHTRIVQSGSNENIVTVLDQEQFVIRENRSRRTG